MKKQDCQKLLTAKLLMPAMGLQTGTLFPPNKHAFLPLQTYQSATLNVKDQGTALDELHMDPRLRISHGNNPASKNVRLPLASTNCNQIRLANKHPLNAYDVDSSSRLHNSHTGLLVRCLRALLPLIIRLS
ncbi:hypothetical protein Peur_062327 [Populus x canadensis]